ncbi:hypothetical protein VZT92_017304 [Zoarces viviparus]|uniref:B30.2/SPRY domain-containing protein n=1 Tax=Zoarces viviparus TaxID=48416 RepID=A0AAW1ERW6_ZOAVI
MDSERFHCPMVLGEEGFTSGRHDWEVQVGLRNNWDVGVAKETVNRKEIIEVERANGFLAIGKRGFATSSLYTSMGPFQSKASNSSYTVLIDGR